jgi:hypothetical protein
MKTFDKSQDPTNSSGELRPGDLIYDHWYRVMVLVISVHHDSTYCGASRGVTYSYIISGPASDRLRKFDTDASSFNYTGYSIISRVQK